MAAALSLSSASRSLSSAASSASVAAAWPADFKLKVLLQDFQRREVGLDAEKLSLQDRITVIESQIAPLNAQRNNPDAALILARLSGTETYDKNFENTYAALTATRTSLQTRLNSVLEEHKLLNSERKEMYTKAMMEDVSKATK